MLSCLLRSVDSPYFSAESKQYLHKLRANVSKRGFKALDSDMYMPLLVVKELAKADKNFQFLIFQECAATGGGWDCKEGGFAPPTNPKMQSNFLTYPRQGTKATTKIIALLYDGLKWDLIIPQSNKQAKMFS